MCPKLKRYLEVLQEGWRGWKWSSPMLVALWINDYETPTKPYNVGVKKLWVV
jgi:hypothetical protein